MFKALLWASVGASLIKFAPAKRVLPGDQFVGIQDKRSVQEHARSLNKKQEDEDVSELINATSREQHLVKSLPGLPNGQFKTRHYAGHVPVEKGFFFYWLFESASGNPDQDPLLIWLNGGPGCSSMDGLWLENGPFRLSDTGDITLNPYSWHGVANVMYVDQPLGTGLSFTTDHNYAESDEQINAQFYLFLKNFYKLHRNLKSRPVFFSGESHAGHYIPSMIAYIRKANDAVAAGVLQGDLVIDVQGMAIGNGWVDPINQYDVSDFAFGAGLIDAGQRRALKLKEAKCISSLRSGKYQDPVCLSLMDNIVADSAGRAHGAPRVSMYDIRSFEIGRSFPPGHATVEAYLNRKGVREAVHASGCPIRFEECTDPPYLHLAKLDGLGVTDDLRTVLNAGVRSLFYNGQYDLICNHVGNQKFLMKLGGWKGAKEWESSRRGVWFAETTEGDGAKHPRTVGYVKEASGNPLTYLLVLDAGHMVPLDHPSHALDMITRFLKGQPFTDKSQELLQSSHCLGRSGGGEDNSSGDTGNDGTKLSEGIYPYCDGELGGVSLPEDSVRDASVYGSVVSAAAKTPPKILGTPAAGQHSAAVAFTPGDLDSKLGAIEYRVVSSPDGVTAIGPGSPITVQGLVPGRTYTFSVAARYTEDENGDGFSDGSTLTSEPSVGSPAVTPGCITAVEGVLMSSGSGRGNEGADRHRGNLGVPCSGHGVCTEDGSNGACLCRQGYAGEACEILVTGDTRGGGGGGGSPQSGETAEPAVSQTIKMLREEDMAMLSGAEWENGPCDVVLRFFIRPGAFQDPEFVFAISTPPVERRTPHVQERVRAGQVSPPAIAADPEALQGLAQGFSTLLRTDMGRSLGVSADMVAVDSVGPVRGKDDEATGWGEWAQGWLNVSAVPLGHDWRVSLVGDGSKGN